MPGVARGKRGKICPQGSRATCLMCSWINLINLLEISERVR